MSTNASSCKSELIDLRSIIGLNEICEKSRICLTSLRGLTDTKICESNLESKKNFCLKGPTSRKFKLKKNFSDQP
jgi:hypothetical protein